MDSGRKRKGGFGAGLQPSAAGAGPNACAGAGQQKRRVGLTAPRGFVPPYVAKAIDADAGGQAAKRGAGASKEGAVPAVRKPYASRALGCTQ